MHSEAQPDAGPTDDDALMARIALRDAAALRLLIDRHATSLHRIAWRMTGDAHEAEDMVQEAMLRLWDQAERWQHGKQGVGAWLKRVVTNMAIDRLRRTRRIAGDAIPEQADESPLADSAMIADEAARQARAMIAALPDKQRAAIVLTYYEELSNAEAADAMAMNIKAFESLLFRARAAIKASFAALPSATEAKEARA